jgi:Gpi18-like mannosyltransferase
VKKTATIITCQLLGTWLFLRCLTSLVVAMFSSFHPMTAIERIIPVWPPNPDILAWLYRVFVAPWNRWDAGLFTQILVRGYVAWDGTTSFNPLFPLLSWPLYRLGLDPTLSLMITGSLAALALFWVFYHLAALDLDPGTGWVALLLLGTFPIAFILFAPYSESLFLLWAALALYGMRRGRWELVAIFSFLAALTRQQGIFLALPTAWWAWEASGKSLRGITKAWRAWLTTLAAPAGLAAWWFYRIGCLHEGSLNFASLQGFI